METALVPVPDLNPALAEIILAVGALGLLMLGAYTKASTTRLASIGAVLLFAVAAIVVIGQPDSRVLTFGGSFVTDGFGQWEDVATWPSNLNTGDMLYLQVWIEDESGVEGFSSSNGLSGETMRGDEFVSILDVDRALGVSDG